MHRSRFAAHPRARALAIVMPLLLLWAPVARGQHAEAGRGVATARLSVVLPEERRPIQPDHAVSKPSVALTPLVARGIVAGAGEVDWAWNGQARSSPFRQSEEDERKRRRRRQLFIAGWVVVGVGLATILLISQGGGGEDGLPSPPDRPGLF